MEYYKKISVSERLPSESNLNYLTVSEKGIETARFFNGTKFESAHYDGEITHWLEKVEDNTLISDGYHTFLELYEFRKIYNATLFNEWHLTGQYNVHKSERHHDGELCFGGGWFVVVALLPTGQITNHYKMEDWDLFRIPAKDKALFEFDGHTPSDVLKRLESLQMI